MVTEFDPIRDFLENHIDNVTLFIVFFVADIRRSRHVQKVF